MTNPFDELDESTITKGIKKYLETRYPGVWYKIHGGPYQEAGIPDIVGCHDGKFFAFEVKKPKRKHKVTLQQEYQINRLSTAGAITGVVTSKADVARIMLLRGIQ